MSTLDVRDLMGNAVKVRAVFKTLRRQKVELENDVGDKGTLATMEMACVDALTYERSVSSQSWPPVAWMLRTIVSPLTVLPMV